MCGDVDLLQGKEAQMDDKQKSELRNEQSEETTVEEKTKKQKRYYKKARKMQMGKLFSA